ncbi:glycosyltransferase WbsX-domain-containing protein [Halenospora varia]|nr:glycosyltransferase WbsX-domain-containing protein [Halenospora varia]
MSAMQRRVRQWKRWLVALVVFTSLLATAFHSKTYVPPVQPADAVNATLVPDYSVKPIAYIFPQYYPFPENDKIWGANFTEWDNVFQVTHNSLGLETIRPAESVGYYNGLDFSTRQRQGKFLLDSGFHGAVYHHYWFAGKPVMDGVIQAMLADGEPNTPFMLNWANEPWTARWDGLDASKTFIAQDYGSVEDWRKHFDWLLPFFRHPKYIRSEGRIQFLVYKPSHVGDLGPHMFAAWRQWAMEEGLGGLDVIETRWIIPGDKWNQAIPDAMNEFPPHLGDVDGSRHSLTNRASRIYHRGTLVCWDSTPRHINDGQGAPQPFCHPKSFQKFIVRMLQKIKEEPNPRGAENFLFVQSLNEWGEGNALEPSMQFGDGYGRAMKKALEISNERHLWPDQRLREALQRTLELKGSENPPLDVCVLVRTDGRHGVSSTFNLPTMLRSLIRQKNQQWKAIVFEAVTALPGIEELLYRIGDLRIKLVTPPGGLRDENNATDWAISQLNISDSSHCGSAKYILITDGDKLYEPNAFSTVIGAEGTLLGMNTESRLSIWNAENSSHIAWEDRCGRLEMIPKLCSSAHPTSGPLDLSATFVSLPHLLRKRTKVSQLISGFANSSLEWDWVSPFSDECHVLDSPSYTGCTRMGTFWLDSPVYSETGCYTTPEFQANFGARITEFDLEGFRRSETATCLKHTKKKYCSIVSCANTTSSSF